MIRSRSRSSHVGIRRSLLALFVSALALALLGATASPAAAASVIWDDPLTKQVEKRPKVKISRSEYQKIIKGRSYSQVKRIADGPGEYFGHCVEGGPCGANVRWYMWRYRGGKVKFDGKWYGRFAIIAFTNGKVSRKFHN